MFGAWGKLASVLVAQRSRVISVTPASAGEPEFRFDRDTFAFANQTVFEYHEGHASLRKKSAVKRDAYNRHCFVLCRTAMQFKNSRASIPTALRWMMRRWLSAFAL